MKTGDDCDNKQAFGRIIITAQPSTRLMDPPYASADVLKFRSQGPPAHFSRLVSRSQKESEKSLQAVEEHQDNLAPELHERKKRFATAWGDWFATTAPPAPSTTSLEIQSRAPHTAAEEEAPIAFLTDADFDAFAL